MGKKAPSPPDPAATAQAQGQVNEATARVQARMNRGNTFGPQGSVTNTDRGEAWLQQRLAEDRQAYADQGRADQWNEVNARQFFNQSNPDRDIWDTRITLSPDQQRIYDQGNRLSIEGGQLALDQLPQVRDLLAQPYTMDDPDARERATAGIMSRMEPQFQRDREGLEGRLLAQGFVPGSEAYNRAADELGRARTDARMQAVTAGLGESRQAAAFANAIRGQRVNELGMLFGLGPGAQSPQQMQMAQVDLAAPDLQGAIYQNYMAKNQATQAANANWFNLAGSAMNAAGSYFGGGSAGRSGGPKR